MDANFFFELGITMLSGQYNPRRRCRATENDRFQALYGVSPLVCSILWIMIVIAGGLDPYCQPKHLLWCFLFLKCYLSENVMAAILNADEKTIHKWVWYMMDALNNLEMEVVSLIGIQC